MPLPAAQSLYASADRTRRGEGEGEGQRPITVCSPLTLPSPPARTVSSLDQLLVGGRRGLDRAENYVPRGEIRGQSCGAK